jgi:hypothetical protein
MRRACVSALALIVMTAGHAAAQAQVMPPLAEVARQAEAAKATTRKAKKTFTNSDLSTDLRGEPAAPAAPTVTSVAGDAAVKTDAAAEKAPATDATAEEAQVVKESEETWRMRAASLRTQIDHVRTRLAQLSTPSASTSESPARKAGNDREVAIARNALDGLRKQWTGLESSARELKVPAAWLEPIPAFPQ